MKTFKELFEVMSVQTRKKMGRRMAKLAKSPAFQFKKKKAMIGHNLIRCEAHNEVVQTILSQKSK